VYLVSYLYHVTATIQYSNIEEYAEYAENWIMFLTLTEARRKACTVTDWEIIDILLIPALLIGIT
jgi:hypothetical protein